MMLRRIAIVAGVLLGGFSGAARAQTACAGEPKLRTIVALDHSSTVQGRHPAEEIEQLLTGVYGLLRPGDELRLIGLAAPGGAELTFDQRYEKSASAFEARKRSDSMDRSVDSLLSHRTSTPSDLARLLQLLGQQDLRRCGDVVLLLTDGSVVPYSIGGRRPVAVQAVTEVRNAAAALRAAGVPIFTVGIDADRSSAVEVGGGAYLKEDSVQVAESGYATGEVLLRALSGVVGHYQHLRDFSPRRRVVQWFLTGPSSVFAAALHLRELTDPFSARTLADWRVEQLAIHVDGRRLDRDPDAVFAKTCRGTLPEAVGNRSTIYISPSASDDQRDWDGCLISVLNPSVDLLHLVQDSSYGMAKFVRLAKDLRVDLLPERLLSTDASQLMLRIGPPDGTGKCGVEQLIRLRRDHWPQRPAAESIRVTVNAPDGARKLVLYPVDTTCFMPEDPFATDALPIGKSEYEFVFDRDGEPSHLARKLLTAGPATPLVSVRMSRPLEPGLRGVHVSADVALHDDTADPDSLRMWVSGQSVSLHPNSDRKRCDSIPAERRRHGPRNKYTTCFTVDTTIYGLGVEPLVVLSAGKGGVTVHTLTWHANTRNAVCTFCAGSPWKRVVTVVTLALAGAGLAIALRWLRTRARVESALVWVLQVLGIREVAGRSTGGHAGARAGSVRDRSNRSGGSAGHFGWWGLAGEGPSGTSGAYAMVPSQSPGEHRKRVLGLTAVVVLWVYPLLTSLCVSDVNWPFLPVVVQLVEHVAGPYALALGLLQFAVGPILNALQRSRS